MNGFSAIVSQISVLKNAPIASPKRKKGPIRFPQAKMEGLHPDQVTAVKAFMIPNELQAPTSSFGVPPASDGKEDASASGTSSQKRRIEESSTQLAKKKKV